MRTLVIVLFLTAVAHAGDLEPPTATPEPTMHTLKEIYDKISSLSTAQADPEYRQLIIASQPNGGDITYSYMDIASNETAVVVQLSTRRGSFQEYYTASAYVSFDGSFGEGKQAHVSYDQQSSWMPLFFGNKIKGPATIRLKARAGDVWSNTINDGVLTVDVMQR